MDSATSEKIVIPEDATSNAESETKPVQGKEEEDFDAPNEFKSMNDYNRFAKATWTSVMKGKNPKLNLMFVKQLLSEMLRDSKAKDVAEIKNFIAKLKATKIEESKQSGKKGVNIGSGKTVEVKRGATHEYEEEYFDDEDYDEDY